MASRTMAALSALWCVLVLAPAVVATVAFHISIDTDITGAAAGVWFLGYLLQFAVFMVISRKATHSTVLGWFVSSIMPWATDWMTPVAWWAFAICAAIVIGYAVLLNRGERKAVQFKRDGLPATGVVIAVIRPWFNMVINSVYIRRTLRLSIELPDGTPPYEVRVKDTFMLGEIPEPGARLSVLVDPARPNRVELVGLSDGPPQTPQPSPTGPDIADQLQKLTSMHQRGDLTDDEFAAAKKQLLDI